MSSRDRSAADDVFLSWLQLTSGNHDRWRYEHVIHSLFLSALNNVGGRISASQMPILGPQDRPCEWTPPSRWPVLSRDVTRPDRRCCCRWLRQTAHSALVHDTTSITLIHLSAFLFPTSPIHCALRALSHSDRLSGPRSPITRYPVAEFAFSPPIPQRPAHLGHTRYQFPRHDVAATGFSEHLTAEARPVRATLQQRCAELCAP